MTSNIFSILNSAKVGLLTQQLAIEVTGQNIANVQTPGYSRQRTELASERARTEGIAIIGTGVRVAGVSRDHDAMLLAQIVNENSNMGNVKTRKEIFDSIEMLLNDNMGRSLNNALSDFFGSIHDLANDPMGLAQRADVLGKAQALTDVFNKVGTGLFEQQINVDARIGDEVTEINTLIAQIAELNGVIHKNENPGVTTANDLRDTRERLIGQLAEKIDVKTYREHNGQVSLVLANGSPLLIDETAYSLTTQFNGNNHSLRDVMLVDGLGNTTNITSSISTGKLKALLDMRDTEISNAIDKLDQLAARFIRDFNNIHQQGLGLDSSTGLNFFNNLPPTVFVNTGNTGNAQISMQNTNPLAASPDKYEIVFTGANTFTLNNLTRGTASGTYTFTSGAAVSLAGGLSATITGAAAAGDKVKFSSSETAARVIAVSRQIVSDSRRIAAGRATTVEGENALELADIQNKLVFDGVSLNVASGSFTFDDFYSSIVSSVGINARASKLNLDQQEGIKTMLTNRRENAAGVSIDEEMINLIKFQQAFNAVARMITTVNEMLQLLTTRT